MAILDLEDLTKLYLASNVCRFSTPVASDFGSWVDLTPLLDLQSSLLEGNPNEVLYIDGSGVATTNSSFTYNETTQIFIVDNTTTDGSYLKVGEGILAYYTDSGGGMGQISIDRSAAKVAISSTSSGIVSVPTSAEAEAVRLYSAKSTGSRTTEIRIIPEYAFLTGASTAGLNIGATDSPVAMLEVQEDFRVTSVTADQYFDYDGTDVIIQVTGVGKVPILTLKNSTSAFNKALISFLQDEEDCGGMAIRNAAGDETIKMDGNDLFGHSFFMNRHFSVGRDGVTATYGGVVDGALFTIDNNFHQLSAATGYGDPNNYSMVIKNGGATSRALAIGFTDATEAEADINVGAAISFQRAGDTSNGSLYFRVKTSPVSTTAPALALTLAEHATFTGAIQVGAYPTGGEPTGVAGMIIYNSTTNKHQGYDGVSWNNLY